jgi:chaperone required for assembly of F1-ATPase
VPSRRLGPHEFSIVVEAGAYSVDACGMRLRTPAGRMVETPNGSLVCQLITEMGSWPSWEVEDGIIREPRPMGAYTLFSAQLDFYDAGVGLSIEDVSTAALGDPVLHPQAGPEQLEQRFAWSPIDEMLRERGTRIGWIPNFGEKERLAVVQLSQDLWSGLSPPEKAAVASLAHRHGSILTALALVCGQMDADQFAHAILATTPLHGVFGFPADDVPADEQHAGNYNTFRDEARTALQFLRCAHIRLADVARLIERGETERVEFKGTALGFPGSKPSERRSAQDKIARTLAAFLSGDGGWLLIGVNKAGVAVGLPEAQQRSIDAIQLALADFIASRLGIKVASRIRMNATTHGGHTLIVLGCEGLGRNVWLEDDDTWVRVIRQGPRTVTQERRQSNPNGA